MDFLFELPFEIIGFALSVIIPLGVLAALMDWKTTKYENLSEFDAQRMEDNLEIIRVLKKYAEDNPSQRIGQILRNCGIIMDIGVKDSSKPEWETPDYYIDRNLLFEEPGVVLRRIEKVLANQYDYDIVIKETKIKNPSGGENQ